MCAGYHWKRTFLPQIDAWTHLAIVETSVEGDLIAVASLFGAAASSDGGDNWSDLTNGLLDDQANVVALRADGYLYVGDDCCVRRSSMSIVDLTGTSSTSLPDVPTRHEVLSVYPNPSSGRVRIKFVVADPAPVDVVAYDASGREIETILSRSMPSGGYDIVWDASRFAHGTYFVRMHVGNRSDSHRVTITD